MLPMAARNEQDQGYSQASFDGFAQPETKELVSSNHVRPGIFQAGGEHGIEIAETLVRIEGCQVINPPVVREWEEKKQKRKEWKCTFVAPPDLWSQERDEWIQAVTENKKDIPVLNKLKLNNGDMCTVIGIHTGERDEPMAKGKKQRHITFVKVTEVIPGIRGTSKKANVLQPKARHG